MTTEWSKQWRRVRHNTVSVVGMSLILLLIIVALFAPHLAPYPQDAGKVVHFNSAHLPPSAKHWFGTDDVGRDIFSRVLMGTGLSLELAVVVLGIALLIGVPLGLIAGYWGGRTATIIMRLTDVFLSVPSLVLALAVSAAFSPTLMHSMIAISFGWWPWFTRLVYGEVLSVKEEQFVDAARSLGASSWRIAFSEIFPNVISPILVKSTLDLGFVILVGASLSFLGLGAQPPTPDWGTMISQGRQYLPDQWWEATFPGLAIFIAVLGFNLFGDGLRDMLDVDLDRWSTGG